MACTDGCAGPYAERTTHVLDYDRDDATSVVTTYRVTWCQACGSEVNRRVVDVRRGMEERLPIGETVLQPTFVRREVTP